jgi:hypothetical protein
MDAVNLFPLLVRRIMGKWTSLLAYYESLIGEVRLRTFSEAGSGQEFAVPGRGNANKNKT